MKLASFTLRRALPLALLAVLVGLMLLVHLDALQRGRAMVLEHARKDLIDIADTLARSAAQDLRDRHDHLDGDVSIVVTDARLDRLVLVDDAGRVVMSHRLAWVGQAASAVMPDVDAARWQAARASLQPIVREDADGRRISAMLSFPMGSDQGRLRDLQQGVVAIDFDLDHELAAVAYAARMRMLPQLGLAVVLMVVLGGILRQVVTRPLARLEDAARRLAQGDATVRRVPEVGPHEVLRLAQSFNQMTVRVDEASRKMASHRDRLQAMFASAMDAIITTGPEQTIRSANAAALRMFGSDEAGLLGRPLTDLMPERHRAAHPDFVSEFGRSASVSRAMGRQSVISALRRDGSEFPVEASISHQQLDGEDLYTVILRDVTERVRAEAEREALNARLESLVEERTAKLRDTTQRLEEERLNLLRATAELSAIFETATIGILLLRERRVVRCNAQAEKIFAAAPGGLDGMPTRRWFLDDAGYEEVGRELYAETAAGRLHRREQQFLRLDGQRFWARISAQTFARGLPDEGLLATIEDVTHEHEAAEALRVAKDLAEQANQAKSHFLANMSHEIRTPMNAIIGITHLAQKTRLDDKQRDYLAKIQQSSQHLLGIINDILDFSKIEANKLELERIEFQLTHVLDGFATLIVEKAAAKGLELIFDVGRDVPDHLIGDPLRLGQILVNYGNNAVKFTQAGEVSVRVRVQEKGDTDLVLRFEVRDTGIGVRQEQLPLLFQSFQQGDSSTSRQFGGTGLGLAIVRRLAELMGGTVGVSSEAGRGSTFWFTARLGLGQAKATPASLGDLSQRRLLIVDDNDTARTVMADVVDSLGFKVDAVEGGEAALDAVLRADREGRPYDAALIDWQMPGMDGLETGRRLAALPLSALPHLMLVTGFGREAALQQAAAQRFEAVLVKPVNASMLLDHLVGVLKPGGVSAAPPKLPNVRPHEAAVAIRGARVLVAEDNAINQQIATELLRDLGLVVDAVENGQLAVQAVQARPYDLVLMDMHMPVMDGLAATEAIRSLPGLQGLPIVAMTANVLPADRARCFAAGMNDFISKPVDPDRLTAVAVQWIQPASVRVPVPPPRSAHAAPASAVDLGSLTGITGLDVASGVRRSGQKAALYLKLLAQFVSGHRDSADRLQRALDTAQHEDARRVAHTLKGVAGNLGAVVVQDLAAQIERHLEAGDVPAARSVLASLRADLALLMSQLSAALPVAEGDEAQGLDLAQLARLAPLLREQLQNGQPEVRQLLDEHAALVQALLGEGYPAFTQAVRRFDFDAALALVEPALARGLVSPPPEP